MHWLRWRAAKACRKTARGKRKGGRASNERSVAIYSWAARARKARQFYGQLGDTSGLIDHRAAGLDLAPCSHTHTNQTTQYTHTHHHSPTRCTHSPGKHDAVKQAYEDFHTHFSQTITLECKSFSMFHCPLSCLIMTDHIRKKVVVRAFCSPDFVKRTSDSDRAEMFPNTPSRQAHCVSVCAAHADLYTQTLIYNYI